MSARIPLPGTPTLWRYAPDLPRYETTRQRQKAITLAMPPAILARGQHILEGVDEMPDTAETRSLRKLVGDWLEMLTMEQFRAEFLARNGVMLPPTVDALRVLAVGAGKCAGPGAHAWGTVKVAMWRLLEIIPAGWRPLEFTCAACNRDAGAAFLIERDHERAEWLRLTFAGVKPITLTFNGDSRHRLAPGQTLCFDNIGKSVERPLESPAVVRDIYREPIERLVLAATSSGEQGE